MKCFYWNKGSSIFGLRRGKERYLFSYGTLVAKLKKENMIISDIKVSTMWDCSRSTTRAVCEFLDKTPKQIRQEIKDGTIKMKGVLK